MSKLQATLSIDKLETRRDIGRPVAGKNGSLHRLPRITPVMNLYANLSGIFSALTTLKLCGASESNLVYIVELHFGYTPRGPPNFRPGYYLRNGITMQDPVLASGVV
jgi:hypothetical protein